MKSICRKVGGLGIYDTTHHMYVVDPGGQPRERGNRILGPFIPIPLTMIDDLKVTPTYKYVSRARMVFT